MDVNFSGFTYSLTYPLVPVQPPPDMAAALSAPQIYPPDEAPDEPRAGALPPDSREPAGRTRDLLNGLVNWLRGGTAAQGGMVRDTWTTDGQRTRDSLDTAGTRSRDTWTIDGMHTHESATTSGQHVRESWDLSGNHLRDAWDENGNHTHDVWDATGRHRHLAWRETSNEAAPVADADAHTASPVGGTGDTVAAPVSGNGIPPWRPSGEDDGDQPRGPAGGGARPFAPVDLGGTGGEGYRPSGPAGYGDIRAPDYNTGPTDYDQPSPGLARRPLLTGFTPEQSRILSRAYQHVKRMIDSALAKLEAGHPDANFARWFGSPTPQNLRKVEQVLTRMQHAMEHDQFSFVLGAPHDNWELANVNFRSLHQINLKPHFFDHAFGAQTEEATIAHELSHFPYIGGTKDHLYGPAAVANLAARNSDLATDNAENYGMFIRAQMTA